MLASCSYADSEYLHLLPNLIMLDAFWRFGTIQKSDEDTMAVYVPQRCRIMRVFYDFTEYDLELLKKGITFTGANPREERNLLHVGPLEARDCNGNVVVIGEGGVCLKYGESGPGTGVRAPHRETAARQGTVTP